MRRLQCLIASWPRSRSRNRGAGGASRLSAPTFQVASARSQTIPPVRWHGREAAPERGLTGSLGGSHVRHHASARFAVMPVAASRETWGPAASLADELRRRFGGPCGGYRAYVLVRRQYAGLYKTG